MKNVKNFGRISQALSMVTLASVLGCSINNPPNPNKLGGGKEDSKPTDTVNVQPGRITLLGVIATSASAPNSAIIVSAEAGLDEQGKRAEVAKENQPILNTTVSAEVVENLKKPMANEALAYGCTGPQIEALLGGGVKASDKKALEGAEKATVVAKRVLLCGENPLPTDSPVSVIAGEVILQGVSWKLNSPAGLWMLTNTLTIRGHNRLATGPAEAGGAKPEGKLDKDSDDGSKETDETDTGLAETAASETTGGTINIIVVSKIGIESNGSDKLLIATYGGNKKPAKK